MTSSQRTKVRGFPHEREARFGIYFLLLLSSFISAFQLWWIWMGGHIIMFSNVFPLTNQSELNWWPLALQFVCSILAFIYISRRAKAEALRAPPKSKDSGIRAGDIL